MTAWDHDTFEAVANYATRAVLAVRLVAEYPETEDRTREGMAVMLQGRAALLGVEILQEDLAFRVVDDDGPADLRLREIKCRWWPASRAAILDRGFMDGFEMEVAQPAPVYLRIPVEWDASMRDLPDHVEVLSYRVESWDPDRRRWVYRPGS